MQLRSNFTDYYDWAFGKSGPVFHRMNDDTGPSKQRQFYIMQEAGFRIPAVGCVGNLMVNGFNKVVAYTDEKAHGGEGKMLLTFDEYWSVKSRLFASQFVGIPGLSWRRLQVGPSVFWLEYKSSESWMSNVGDGSCEVIGVEMDTGFHPKIDLPLFAIDFAIADEMYAIDFNVAPGVRGSGVERYLTGKQFVEKLEFAHEKGVWRCF